MSVSRVILLSERSWAAGEYGVAYAKLLQDELSVLFLTWSSWSSAVDEDQFLEVLCCVVKNNVLPETVLRVGALWFLCGFCGVCSSR